MLNETTGAIMQTHYMGAMEGMGHHGWGMVHGPFSIVLLAMFILLVFWLFRRAGNGKGMCGHGTSSSALTTLSDRFAKGEIDEEEFRSKREVLKSKK